MMFPVKVGSASTYPVEEHKEWLDNGCHQPSRSPIQIGKAFVSILSVGRHRRATPLSRHLHRLRGRNVFLVPLPALL